MESRENSTLPPLDRTPSLATTSPQQHTSRSSGTSQAETGRPKSLESFVDVEVASCYLSVASKTLNQLAREGKIPAYPWGAGTLRRSWRFKLSELDAWMTARLHSNSRPPLPNRRRK